MDVPTDVPGELVCPELRQCDEGCCGEDEVCLRNACTQAGPECATSDTCGANEYCEPLVGRCLPRGETTCEYRPPAGEFTPTLEWEWPFYSRNPNINMVIAAPAVADVDGDGTPDVVFVVMGMSDSLFGFETVLVVLDGRTGDERLVIDSPTEGFNPGAAVALGELRSDQPGLEIVVVVGDPYSAAFGGGPAGPAGLALYSASGSLLWQVRLLSQMVEGPAPFLADLDADGVVEIGYGGQVFDPGGRSIISVGDLGGVVLPFTMGAMWAPLSFAADVNADGVQELIGSNRVVGLSGTELWRAPGAPSGFAAVGDLDVDHLVDVVFVEEGHVGARRGADGSLFFGPIRHPGANLDFGVLLAGPPTIADFDGDGRPEIGAGSSTAYAVFDPDCQARPDPSGCDTNRTDGILWSHTTVDHSGGVTASSVFDFEGDGRAEVLHNDECTLRVFDGRNGDVLWETINPTGTVTDYNLVVDVDGDFNAEIVAVSNEITGNPTCGSAVSPVRVFGDQSDNWVPTRRIWNQHAYHITNVNDDGTIPATPEAGFETHNSFRQNQLAIGSAFDAPDLVIRELRSLGSTCPDYLLEAVIENIGTLGVGAGVPVSFYFDGATSPAATVTTTEVLLPGSTTTVSATVTLPDSESERDHDVEARVDADRGSNGQQNECREDNNSATTSPVRCQPLG